MVTDEFLAQAARYGWVSWRGEDQDPSYTFFQEFPVDVSDSMSCTFGPGRDVGTDNVASYAWGRIDPTQAETAQAKLVQDGYARLDTPEGVYLSYPDQGTFADQDGYGVTYLFTNGEVRFAMTRTEIQDFRTL